MDPVESYLLNALQTLGPSHWGKPIIAAVMASITDELQELDDVIFATFARHAIDTADHAGLITLGKLVGQGPRGYTDEMFRRAIRARIAANNSDGTLTSLFNVCHLLFDPDASTLATMYAHQHAYNTYHITITSAPPEGSRNAAAEIIPLARQGGERVLLDTQDPISLTWMTQDL